jgi:ketosteroid isomerase-like protein
MTTPQNNAERIRKLYQAFEFGGEEAAAKLIGETFDPDVEFNPLQAGDAGGRTYRGFQGLAGFFAELTESLEDVHYDPPQFHPVGNDLVIVFTRLVGTEKDTSLPLQQDLSLVYEISEGLVRCVTAYDSPAEALEAAERGHADA